MFKIFEFIETHEVELVPAIWEHIWEQNGQCSWPNLKGMALHQAIKNVMAPSLEWDRGEVKTMYITGKCYILKRGFTYFDCYLAQHCISYGVCVILSLSLIRLNVTVFYRQL